MKVKNIYFQDYQNPLKLGDIFMIGNVVIPLTQELIDQNPTQFKVSETDEDVFVRIKFDVDKNSGRWASNESGRVYKVVDTPQKTEKFYYYVGKTICIDPIDCEPATKQDFIDQILKNAANRGLINGAKYKLTSNIASTVKGELHCDESLKGVYDESSSCVCYIDNNDITFATVINPIITSSDNVAIYEGDACFAVTSDFKLHPKIVKCLDDVEKDEILFFNESNAKEWVRLNKPKTIYDYEIMLVENPQTVDAFDQNGLDVELHYATMKTLDPHLYWLEVLRVIADDLNKNHSNSSVDVYWWITYDAKRGKYCTNAISKTYLIMWSCFKYRQDAEKAIELLGINRLDIILKKYYTFCGTTHVV